MLPEIYEISRRRKSIGMKQKELAKLSGVSQSFIAKLESGKIKPSYENVKRILEVLESKEHEKHLTAKDVMHKGIISISKDDRVSKAIKLMKKHEISQLPVMHNDVAIGSITDKSLIDQIEEENDIKELSELTVSSVMSDSFPQIPENTPLPTITMLLRHNQALLVTKSGKVKGIISKSDLLRTK